MIMDGTRPTGISQAALRFALEEREVTRRDVANELEISFPTATSAINELVAANLLVELRTFQGPRGRASTVYGPSSEMGWILGVDIGATHVSCIAESLTELTIHSETLAHEGDSNPGRLARQIIATAMSVTDAPLRGLGIAINQVVPTNPGPGAPTRFKRTEKTIAEALKDVVALEDLPIAVENNVNCSAMAEYTDGEMKGLPNSMYMQVGVGIGLGIFCNGTLIRGASGGSGELAQIPLSWDPGVPSPQDAIEKRYGSRGLLADAAKRLGDEAPDSVVKLFAMAAGGNRVALETMRDGASSLARIAAAAAAVLDPAVVVVGGGLTKNSQFADFMIEEFRKCQPHIQMRVSTKGNIATAQGATLIARDAALTDLLGNHYRPRVPQPALWGINNED